VSDESRLEQQQDGPIGGNGESLTYHPIGFVRNSFANAVRVGPSDGVPSEIVLFDSYKEGIEGLKPGQEILVLFWFHCSSGYQLRQHPRGDRSRPLRGVFALRSPHRPNPIGVTQATITKLEDGVLSVTALDAFDGTPVLDIKPADAVRRL